MKTIVLYYTLGGSTKEEAELLAKRESAELVRVKDKREKSVLGAFLSIPAAAGRKSVSPDREVDLLGYDRIIIGCPVWAGHPAPMFNTMVQWLPSGKEVEVFLCSAGGETKDSKEGTAALVKERGCSLLGYRDVKTGKKPAKLKE